MRSKQVEVLLIEDDLGDVELTQEALEKSKLIINLNVVNSGDEALTYLRQEEEYSDAVRPNLILLDLNLPGLNGREVLAEIKRDKSIPYIPIVVLTTSDSDKDILESYQLGANCYVTKPLGLNEFTKIVSSIEDFWFAVVQLPR